MKRSQTEKPAPGWQLVEPAYMMLLLMLVADDPVVVVDQPCHCGAGVKQTLGSCSLSPKTRFGGLKTRPDLKTRNPGLKPQG